MQLAGDMLCVNKHTPLPVIGTLCQTFPHKTKPTEDLAKLCLLCSFCASSEDDNHRKEIHLFIIPVFHMCTHIWKHANISTWKKSQWLRLLGNCMWLWLACDCVPGMLDNCPTSKKWPKKHPEEPLNKWINACIYLSIKRLNDLYMTKWCMI